MSGVPSSRPRLQFPLLLSFSFSSLFQLLCFLLYLDKRHTAYSVALTVMCSCDGNLLVCVCVCVCNGCDVYVCRGESADTLGQSLATNNHLITLNLAYNSIGDSGAQQLAHSLRFNASLKFLDVSFNHLGPRTALVFSQVLDSTDVLQS